MLSVPAARAAFYRVYVDTGKGPQYWGLYSMIEDPADGAMLDAQFGSHSGNLYKPEGAGADWTQFSKQGFDKKNHNAAGDYSDVEAAVAALNAARGDAVLWRNALEARFDVDHFLHWLAVNTLFDNWDVYGAIAHNYYLYADPRRGGKLVWIPWDHNEAFASARAGGGRGFGRGGSAGAAQCLRQACTNPAHADRASGDRCAG
jgi:spore coat protein H